MLNKLLILNFAQDIFAEKDASKFTNTTVSFYHCLNNFFRELLHSKVQAYNRVGRMYIYIPSRHRS